jgi:hypothetical protein
LQSPLLTERLRRMPFQSMEFSASSGGVYIKTLPVPLNYIAAPRLLPFVTLE